ncbi:hypothetical protein [Arcobacter sp. F2176]|uniref:hypothetical protein n=1 Tax=Arcobacter sp. F2176 TaxID=2044511 RepID=UPI00100A6CB9|nr:hypothetical protein [Arcobacter sp. F2176]
MVRFENTKYEIASMLFMVLVIAYPLIYFGLEFHSFYNFDFYFYSVMSNWLLDHDITTRILDNNTIMDSVLSSSMRDTMVTRIFTEFFTAFSTVIPSYFGYETRNLFMVNHTIFAIILPVMVLRVLGTKIKSNILLLLLVGCNALIHFGYFYQLFPQTVGMVLSFWIIFEFKNFIQDNRLFRLTISILVLFITYPEITPVVLLPLIISFFLLKGLNRKSFLTFGKVLSLFFILGVLLTNYYFIDMFKFLIEQILHGFQSNIKEGEILFPYYLNYSGFISLFGLLTTPNDFSLNVFSFISSDIVYLILGLYSIILMIFVIIGIKTYYKENIIVFSAFIMYLSLFILFFAKNKDFSTFKIAFLIQPYLIIGLYYGLRYIERKWILYAVVSPYIILNLVTSFTYSYMSLSDNGVMREVKGDMISQGGEFKNIQKELQNDKYTDKVFSTTVTNLALEHWISYFLRGKEQVIPLIGKQLGSGKYNITGHITLNIDNHANSVDYFILETKKSNVLNEFNDISQYEYKSDNFEIVQSSNISNFIIPNRITSPYLMEASMYKEDLMNFPWYLFKDITPFGEIGHLSNSSDFYIINPSKDKSKFIFTYSGYYTSNTIEKIKLYNTHSKKTIYYDNANRTFTRVVLDDIIPLENQQFSYVAEYTPSTKIDVNNLTAFLNKANPSMRDIVISLYQFSFIDDDLYNSKYKIPSIITTKEMIENELLPINGIYEDGWAINEINTELQYDKQKHTKFYFDYNLPEYFNNQKIQIYIDNKMLEEKIVDKGEHKLEVNIANTINFSKVVSINLKFSNMNIISPEDKRESSIYMKSFGFK